ncbi:TetR family transcriptional regulator [Rhodococcoides kyotonense]|uniref:DNA-binding transcriptional regulator, AcrR family n=1 Tax=Rhodococcoides kyotonense TaxID=398843 RepID=A0A239MG22_9NOCA|nr:TetR family transcriptional regulator [Rhodococcus kyotonensis]SNT41123.1 DNA-binding transcriptional regulator, AcrR family [Rhodococcus kyotonensis]
MGDATATRERILEAGTAEFAQFGLAGARVDRIASNASINKAQIYSYFGSKDKLFDAVFDYRVDLDIATVPLDADDIPGYVIALYDMYLGDPALGRLLAWARLERTPVGALFHHRGDPDRAKLDVLADAQERGVLVDDIAPEDLWAMIVSLAATWAQAAIVHTADADEDPLVHSRRKGALASTARRAFCQSID